jgi:glycine/D-amino acid oxidase-like deaminating enzyme
MRRIAVIGAGIFGCEISVALAKSGYDVTLFEKKDEILNGSTTNSVRRLHLGFRYPRSVETAVQSRLGFRKFMERYPESVDSNFPNYYAIAKEDSKPQRLNLKPSPQLLR